MNTWKNACSGDLRRFKAINHFLKPYPKLIDHLFKTDKAELNYPTMALRKSFCQFSTGEQILARAALDIWSDSGQVTLPELTRLDPENFKNVLIALLMAQGFGPRE